MKILALDQSSRITGWSIINDGKIEFYGKFELTEQSIDARLTALRQQILTLIQEYKPDKVIYEDIQEQNNIVTFKILAMVYGVVTQLLDELNIPHESILAVQWKSVLGIKGKQRAEQKRNAQQFILNNYGIKAIQDICDSICIGLAYIEKNRCAWSK